MGGAIAGAVVLVSFVERLDGGACVGKQGAVIRQGLLGSVNKIRQQRKVQIWIAITEITYLQGIDQIIDLRPTAQQAGNDDHAAVNLGNTLGEIQAWQCSWWHEQRDRHVYQSPPQRRSTNQGDNRKKPVTPVMHHESTDRI